MPKPRTHHLDVYDCRLHVATSEKQWAKLQRRYDLADNDSLGATHLFVDTIGNQPHLAIWLDPTVTGRKRADLIAHEATHAAAQLLDHIGQKADRHDSETLAYLVGWIAGWLTHTTT